MRACTCGSVGRLETSRPQVSAPDPTRSKLRGTQIVLLHSKTLVATLVALLLLTGTLASRPAMAQEASGAQLRIAVVNLQDVIEQSEARKAKYAELEKLRATLQTDLDALAAKIEKAQKDFEASATKLGEDERIERKTQIETDITNWKAEMEKRQRQVDTEEKKIMKEVFDKVDATIKAIAEKENYHLVLRAGALPSGSVLYYSPTVDITSKVLGEINKK
jgi:outer membrane protein